MHRTFVRDFHQPLALLGIERAFHRNHAIDLIEHAFAGFAFRTVFRVDLAVLQRHGDAIERQRLALGIEPHGHGCAGAKRGQQEIVRCEPRVLAACGNRLVGD